MWLKEGDRNTKFFHMKATGWAKKNKIKQQWKEDGRVTKDKKEMGDMVKVFFQQLYTNGPEVCPQELLQLMEPRIFDEMNEGLCKDFSSEEIAEDHSSNTECLHSRQVDYR
jgi:cytochrome oxidase Cu insertion factor (SCO1/SenC/PrrC family)